VWRSIQKEHQDPPADPTSDLNSNAPPTESEGAVLPPGTWNLIELPVVATHLRRPGRRAAGDDQQMTFGF